MSVQRPMIHKDVRPSSSRKQRTKTSKATPRPKRFPKRKSKVGLFFVCVFIFLGVYVIGYARNNIFGTDVSQMRVEMGFLSQPTSFSGLIIRDEVVYSASTGGALVFQVPNHERVRRGSVVAVLQDAATVEAYSLSLAQVEQSAIRLGQNRAGIAANEDEITHRNRHVLNQINSISLGLSAGNIEEVFNLSNNVRQGLRMRNDLNFSDEPAMMELSAARNQVISGLSDAATQITAASAGVVSVVVDGLEDILTVQNLGNITKDTIDRPNAAPSITNIEVSAGDRLFRIVRSNNWFIAAFLPGHYTENWGMGSNVVLFVNYGEDLLPLSVQVHSLSSQGSEVYVVFSTNREMMRFIDIRHITFQLERNPRSGYKIPRSAIVEISQFPVPAEFVRLENNVWVVDLLINETARTEPIWGSWSLDRKSFYITAGAAALRVGDVIVNNGNTFTLDLVVSATGVFATNVGATQFRQIDMTGLLAENDDYIILDPIRNPNIRPFDRIVSDARAVSDRQLLH